MGSTKKNKDSIATEYIVGDDKRFKFNLKYTSPTKQQYEGTFVSRIPTVKDILTIGAREAEHFRDTPNMEAVPISVQNLAYMLATLKTCLVEWPSWFNINEIEDIELLEGIYREHSAAVDSFRSRISVDIKRRN